MNDTNIHVHIERLVLDGLPIWHSQRPLVQAAVESELARLLSTDGLAANLMAGGAMPYISGGNIQLKSEGDPGFLGQQIAQAIYGGIGGNGNG